MIFDYTLNWWFKRKKREMAGKCHVPFQPSLWPPSAATPPVVPVVAHRPLRPLRPPLLSIPKLLTRQVSKSPVQAPQKT